MNECKICNQTFENSRQLLNHLKSHNIDYQTYLKTYVYKPFLYYNIQINPGICPICGNSIKLTGFKLKKFCCHKCANEFMKSESFISEIDKKRRQTCAKKYGDENYRNSEKSKETKLKKYGDSNFNNRKKAEQTCIELYGVEYAPQAKIVKEKIKNTSLEKYGVPNPGASAEAIEKLLKTNNERYGANSALQTPNGKATLKQILASESVKKKVYETHKKNNSFHTSKPELKLLKILQDKFGKNDIEYQYRSDLYPYNCDFYIKSLDLYIELQGSWIHGKAPYDATNEKHIKKLLEWQEKAQTSRFYRNAIDVWTRADVEKRRVAKENGIKLIEVFDSENFSELKDIL